MEFSQELRAKVLSGQITVLRRSGEADLGALRLRAAHAGPVRDDTLVYRIEFHAVE